MAKRSNQKQKLLILRELLLRQSDEEHPVAIAEMIAELERLGLYRPGPSPKRGYVRIEGDARA